VEKISEETKSKFDLEDRLIEFSVMVIGITESLPETRTCAHLCVQLLRSGTSAALNYGEAQGAESRKDFVHKIKVILKELRESRICLRILSRRSLLQNHTALTECNELVAIFTKSVRTASLNPDQNR
jgi:four helix bundle protein